MNEKWFCVNCKENNRPPLVSLDKHGRCAECDSEAVMIPTTGAYELSRSNGNLVYRP